TLAMFLPFTWLSVPSGILVWLVVKLVLLGILVVIWRREFVPQASWPLVLGLTFFGFNAAVLWDLRTGNVSVLEQLLLWLPFARYAGGHRKSFAALVVAASIFKLQPILFLALLLRPDETGRSSFALA